MTNRKQQVLSHKITKASIHKMLTMKTKAVVY